MNDDFESLSREIEKIRRQFEPFLRQAEQARQSFEPILRQAEQARQNFEPLASNAEAVRAALESLSIRRAIDQFETDFAFPRRLMEDVGLLNDVGLRAAEQVRQFESNFGTLAEAVRAALVLEERVHENAIAKLHATGWIGLETLLSYADLDELAEQPTSSLDGYICSLFTADGQQRLIEMIDGWMDIPYLASRRQLLDQCLTAHSLSLWAVAIPSLLPLLDGLSAEIASVPGMITDADAGKLIKVSAVISSYRSEDAPESLSERWTTLVIDFVQGQVFAKSSFGKTPPPDNPFNRHWILHGRVPMYWSEANSLRAFLLVHVLAQVARLAEDRA